MSITKYHPMVIKNASSKLLELFIQDQIDGFIKISCSQFGFKARDGCDMLLKACVNYYVNGHSTVFTRSFDTFKGFDRVNRINRIKQ